MSTTPSGRQMMLLWLGVLLGPVAWSVSLTSMFWLIHPVCQGTGRGVLWAMGVACLLIAIVAGAGTAVALARAGSPEEHTGIGPFMLRLGAGISAIFSLVILLSMVPIGFLTPCPV